MSDPDVGKAPLTEIDSLSSSRLYREGDLRRRWELPGSRALPAWRSPFRRDFARLVHSSAFRRLQGKTQLFAGEESDYFRNRLTHSLEVAQIAKTIASKLNHETLTDEGLTLDLDLVEVAALAHDLGHPPFGHNGEHALDGLMRDQGGFEGNAQTLRIVARLEKKLDAPHRQLRKDGSPRWFDRSGDAAIGLNLCNRTLAAILKYDEEIPRERGPDQGLVKGYYESEAELVSTVRRGVLRKHESGRCLKTIECQIMDLADDIAYSTYDIEDAFKAGLLTPFDLVFAEDSVLETVAQRCAADLDMPFDPVDVIDTYRELLPSLTDIETLAENGRTDIEAFASRYRTSKLTAEQGFFRSSLTGGLVDRAIRAVTVEVDDDEPGLSTIGMSVRERAGVAVLKHLVYVSLIESPRMRMVARRGIRIVGTIFGELIEPDGHLLMPGDWIEKFEQAPADPHRYRVVADFIAGMTDRQAVDFYRRLTSSDYQSMFALA